MRKQTKFSEFGQICQGKKVGPGETAKIFNLKIPKNYTGFLYYLANNYFPLELNIDGQKMEINKIMGTFDSPQLFDPPFLVNEFIEVIVTNTTNESKQMDFYADGVAYYILTPSDEAIVNEIKEKLMAKPGFEPVSSNIRQPFIKTEERNPRTPHLINYNIHEANKWYEIKFPEKVITWQLKARGTHDIYYSFEPSHSTYMTLPSGNILSEDTSPNMNIRAVYVMCETAEVVEVELWMEGTYYR